MLFVKQIATTLQKKIYISDNKGGLMNIDYSIYKYIDTASPLDRTISKRNNQYTWMLFSQGELIDCCNNWSCFLIIFMILAGACTTDNSDPSDASYDNDTSAGSKTDNITEINAETDTDAGTNAGADSNIDDDPDADRNSDPDADRDSPDATSDSDVNADNDADTDADKGAEPCGVGGKVVAGDCWYLGKPGETCTDTCSPYGKYKDVTLAYAGSEGNPANCAQVASAFETGITEATMIFEYYGIGCVIDRTSGTPSAEWYFFLDTEAGFWASDKERLCACGSEIVNELFDFNQVTVSVAPYGVEMTAIIKVVHEGLLPEDVIRFGITVHGQGDSIEDLTADLYPNTEAYKVNFDISDKLEDNEIGIPILGLHYNTSSLVTFEIETESDVYRGQVTIQTGDISEEMLAETESATAEVLDSAKITPGWTWVTRRVYDNAGNLRWFGPRFYVVLRNGNLLRTNLDEINLMGKTIIARQLPSNLSSHHDAIELPNDNILYCANEDNATLINKDGDAVPCVEDHIVELDSNSVIQNIWNLREYRNVDRRTSGGTRGAVKDWIHVNTLWYDEEDDAILVSGAFQGIIKITRGGIQGEDVNKNKELVWILAPKMGWDSTGANVTVPPDLNDYLLTAVNSLGTAYPEEVQNNLIAPDLDTYTDDFRWPISQHGLHIIENDSDILTLLNFNNCASKIFNGLGRTEEPYSLIVEYEINESTKTVRELWSYGENMPEYYSGANSGVNYFQSTGNRLMISNGQDVLDEEGNIVTPRIVHIVEVTEQGEVVLLLEIGNTSENIRKGRGIELYNSARSL